MQRARRVRDEVERRIGMRPEVRLIDIAADGRREPDSPPLVVQVHVARPMRIDELGLETQIDGIAIRVVPALSFSPQ